MLEQIENESQEPEKVIEHLGLPREAKTEIALKQEEDEEDMFEDILTLHQFEETYNQYPQCDYLSLYLIYRDLRIKNELRGVKMVDAFPLCGKRCYVLQGEFGEFGHLRLIVPVHFDDDVDLNLLLKLSLCTKEMYLCLYTTDTMIYQLFEYELPKLDAK